MENEKISGKKALPPLNDAQRRGLSCMLQILDASLCEFELYAQGYEARAVMYRLDNTLTPRQRELLLAEIASIRSIISEMKDTLRLYEDKAGARGKITAKCGTLWEGICELRSKAMRRYGEMKPEQAHYLDPRVEELMDRVQRLAEIARRRQ